GEVKDDFEDLVAVVESIVTQDQKELKEIVNDKMVVLGEGVDCDHDFLDLVPYMQELKKEDEQKEHLLKEVEQKRLNGVLEAEKKRKAELKREIREQQLGYDHQLNFGCLAFLRNNQYTNMRKITPDTIEQDTWIVRDFCSYCADAINNSYRGEYILQTMMNK